MCENPLRYRTSDTFSAHSVLVACFHIYHVLTLPSSLDSHIDDTPSQGMEDPSSCSMSTESMSCKRKQPSPEVLEAIPNGPTNCRQTSQIPKRQRKVASLKKKSVSDIPADSVSDQRRVEHGVSHSLSIDCIASHIFKVYRELHPEKNSSDTFSDIRAILHETIPAVVLTDSLPDLCDT